MKTLTKLIASSVLMVTVSACETKKNDSKDTKATVAGPTVNKDAQTVTVTVNQNMDADALVDAGEQLIGPYTFNLADKAFEMALQKDPSNLKAQFYRAFLKRVMVMRGILVRLRPYAAAYGNIIGLENTIATLPNHPMKKFLLDGKEDIKDIADIQNFLVTYRNAVEEFHTFAAKHPDLELDLYMNPSVFSERITRNYMTSCTVQSDRNYTCNSVAAATLKLNAADLVVLKQEAAGEMLYFTMLTAYSVAGIEPLIKDIEASDRTVCSETRHSDQYGSWYDYECTRPNRQVSEREKMLRLERTPGFGHLNAGNTMGKIMSLGADFTAAAKWVIKYQRELCPNGIEADVQRPGYLYDGNTLCLADATESQRSLALFERAISGVTNIDFSTMNGPVTAAADFPSFFNKPVQDLRSLMPATYGACDNATSFRDKTFGGLFPNGEADKVMIRPDCRSY